VILYALKLAYFSASAVGSFWKDAGTPAFASQRQNDARQSKEKLE